MNQKGFSQFILVIIVGAVFVVAGGSVWYYQQSAEQNNKSTLETQAIPESSSSEMPSVPTEPPKEVTKLEDKSVVQKEPPKEVAEQLPKSSSDCDLTPSPRQFSNTPYYTGPLVDNHFHMPSIGQVHEGLAGEPILDENIARSDIICLFDKENIKNAFGFYLILSSLKEESLQSIREIERQYAGRIIPFLVLASHETALDPPQVEEVMNSNKGLFKGYGEVALYFELYNNMSPNDPLFLELYKVADRHNLIVMMHPIATQQQALEQALRDYPNVVFLFHGWEMANWATALLSKYPNAHYSLDADLFGDSGFFYNAGNKENFSIRFKQNWQNTLNKTVGSWKSKIEQYPDQFLWGTDRGGFLWQYDSGVGALLEEFSRAFIGQLNPVVQEKFAYKNAERLLQER